MVMHTRMRTAPAVTLTSETPITAAINGKPRESSHSTTAIMNPSHAAEMQIAETNPHTTIHISARPARRPSSDTRSRRFESTARTAANAVDNSLTTPAVGGEDSALAPSVRGAASPAGPLPLWRGCGALSIAGTPISE